MLHLRITAPAPLARPVQAALSGHPYAINVAVYAGASIAPAGDVITCDVPREAASAVIDELKSLGIAEHGSIAVESIDTSISDAFDRVEREAPGFGVDAVVWEEVEARTNEEATLSGTFLTFMIVATLIAGIAVILDSSILVVGAMVVGPEFGPLAGLAVATVQRKRLPALRSLLALAVGFPVAIVATYVGTLILDAVDSLPANIDAAHRPFTGFIAQPDEFSVLVALLAGVAGMLSLTSSKSGPLIGVLVSVTTIPAAGNMAVAGAIGQWDEAGRSAVQLGVNLTFLLLSAMATLHVQRALAMRRRRQIS